MWERLRNPEAVEPRETAPEAVVPFTKQREAFLRLVRHEVFAFLKRIAGRDCVEFEVELAAYFETHQAIRLDPEARNGRWTLVKDGDEDGELLVEQTLIDPDELNDWSVRFVVDLKASDEEERVVMRATGLAPFA